MRWLCFDSEATRLVWLGGVQIFGARVIGSLDLTNARVPFGLVLDHCAIAEPLNLEYADLAFLDLSGSCTHEIYGADVHVRGAVTMGFGFHAEGPVDLSNSRIGGSLFCTGGNFSAGRGARRDFRSLAEPGKEVNFPFSFALAINDARIEGDVRLCCGFQSDGNVFGTNASFNSMILSGGRFHGMVVLDAAKVGGNVVAGPFGAFTGARFLGESTEPHGLEMQGTSLAGGLYLSGVELQNAATLDLRASSVIGLVDDEKSWPQPGSLALEGFTYGHIYAGPADTRNRLRWLGLGSGPHPPWLVLPGGFQPQPYQQLAHVLRNGGDEAGARAVLVAEEDARYRELGTPARLWGTFLKYTIGYGHRPLLAIFWMAGVVGMGWALVAIGKRAGVMRLTWPETTPLPTGDPTTGLSPLLYSLDVFLPFVNLHQEHYWWPDESAAGTCRIAGLHLPVRGSVLRTYLWLQIIAGWLLSAIFVAGVTGLIRGD